MMKLLFLLILSLFNHGGNKVTADPTADDLPDLTLPVFVITVEELSSLNQLRKDVVKSLEDLRANMESDESKKVVNNIMERVLATMKKDSYVLTDETKLLDHVLQLLEVLHEDLAEGRIGISEYGIIENESDNDKMKDFMKKTVPELRKRFEPFEEKYAYAL